jgi:signal peptidase I
MYPPEGKKRMKSEHQVKMIKNPAPDLPSVSQIRKELDRTDYRSRFNRILKSTVSLLIVAAALAILIVTLWMPVIRVYGNSMASTLEDGDIVVLVKGTKVSVGDVIAFYYNNKILIKRVVAMDGDVVDISQDGTVSVNGEILDEDYVYEKAYGECDIEFPYKVPQNRIFVLGDHRSVSVDSRSSQIGCVSEEQIVGRMKFRVWPFNRISGI